MRDGAQVTTSTTIATTDNAIPPQRGFQPGFQGGGAFQTGDRNLSPATANLRIDTGTPLALVMAEQRTTLSGLFENLRVQLEQLRVALPELIRERNAKPGLGHNRPEESLEESQDAVNLAIQATEAAIAELSIETPKSAVLE